MNTDSHANETFSSLKDDDLGKSPPIGHLTFLKTKAEAEARFRPIEAHIARVPASRASITVRAIDNALREVSSATSQPLQHLRRFAKLEHLPDHLRALLVGPWSGQSTKALAHQEEYGNHDDEVEDIASHPPSLYFLICASTDLSVERIRSLLGPDDVPLLKDNQASISSITVPGLPPTSEAQARQWSQQHWPTIYKKHNPFGAHPSIISHAASEIEGNVGDFMNIARDVGKQVSDACLGEAVGAVVVDRSQAGEPSVVMVTGDARWNLAGRNPGRKVGNGNVMAHAVMRAISLIANKRQDAESGLPAMRSGGLREAFTDVPLTSLEQLAYSTSRIKPGGYLCLDLEFYLTHEPCVMCSMALLHSRVGRVIFEQQMIHTGGLTAGLDEDQAEQLPGLGYGLFWRPSLNWKFLTWQWSCTDGAPLRSLERLHA